MKTKFLLTLLITGFAFQFVAAQSWLLTGNAGTTPGTNFLGTTDAKNFIFKTNNIERGRILSSGQWRFGTTANYAEIDAAGKLSFTGSGAYSVGGNKYAFQYDLAPNYGLFFNSTDVRYEFRNGSAAPIFHINANTGDINASGKLSFGSSGGYYVSGNKYAFQYDHAPNYGLFFNSTAMQYEFRNGSANPIFYVNANSGNGVFNGTLKVGSYTLPSSDGTNNQVLKTNGSGTLSWSNDNGTAYIAGTGISISGTTISNTGDLNGADDANLSLSNLNGTSINQRLVPYATNTLDLGSNVNAWKDLYLDGAVYLGSARFLASQSGTGTSNTAVGISALNANTTGHSNTAVGYNALFSNTTGYSNVANGDFALFTNTTGLANSASGSTALQYNTTGSFNTAQGDASLHENTIGIGNVALGYVALYANISGNYNTATGQNASYQNTTGSFNTANGYQALRYNSTGNSNTAFGTRALFYNTDRSYLVAIGDSALFNNGTNATYSTDATANTAVGSKTLFSNTRGAFNTATGKLALYSNQTGFHNVAIGNKALYKYNSDFNTAIGDSALANNVNGGTDVYSANTALGYGALTSTVTSYENTALGAFSLWDNTLGNYNTASGSYALNNNTTGSYNVAAGKYSLNANTSGSNNVAIGYSAGSFNDIDNNCTFIGNDADQLVTTNYTNSTALGNTARITGSNQARIGNSAVTSIGGYANWTNISDERVKKNIKENVPGLEFINKLKPVTYNLNVTGIKSFLKEDNNDDKTDKANKDVNEKSNALIEQGIKEKEKIIYTGFVAQDVEAVAKKINYDFSGVDKPQDENGLYGLRYAEFVVPLVKAVQELSKQNDDLQKQIEELKSMQFQGNNNTGSTEKINQQNVELNGAFSLSQNIPNPFTNSTQINYYLPVNTNNACINFYAINGALLKSVKLSGNGKGNISVKANELPSGAYKYALLIDGKIMDSKSMILSK